MTVQKKMILAHCKARAVTDLPNSSGSVYSITLHGIFLRVAGVDFGVVMNNIGGRLGGILRIAALGVVLVIGTGGRMLRGGSGDRRWDGVDAVAAGTEDVPPNC